MGEKSFVTVYDTDCEEYAAILMALASKDKSICNINRSTEEFKKDRTIVSGEYVLTIGKKGSAYHRKNFNDTYYKYGIHIGFVGTKAWISCERFRGDDEIHIEFIKEVYSILEITDMKTDDIRNIVEKINRLEKEIEDLKAQEEKILEELEAKGEDVSWIRDNNKFFYDRSKFRRMKREHPVPFGRYLDLGADRCGLRIERANECYNTLSKAELRNLQYRFAVALFYDKYVHDFLGMKKEENEERKKEENKKENF